MALWGAVTVPPQLPSPLGCPRYGIWDPPFNIDMPFLFCFSNRKSIMQVFSSIKKGYTTKIRISYNFLS